MVKGLRLLPVKLPGILGAVWNGTETDCTLQAHVIFRQDRDRDI